MRLVKATQRQAELRIRYARAETNVLLSVRQTATFGIAEHQEPLSSFEHCKTVVTQATLRVCYLPKCCSQTLATRS
jgi:hypothetical protein